MKPPDPIPAPVRMSEAQAIRVLLAIARIHGGYVVRLGDTGRIGNPGLWRRSGALGFAIMPHGPATVLSWMQEPTWTWSADLGVLVWTRPSALGGGVVPLGRIDRGLGAAR